MFDPQSGMLPNSAKRIFFAVALKWISEDTFHNLNIIRKIRNEFAHDIGCEDLSHAKIRGFLASLTPLNEEQFELMLKAAAFYDGDEGNKLAEIVAEYETGSFLR